MRTDSDERMREILEDNGGVCGFFKLIVANHQPYVPCGASLRSIRQYITIDAPQALFGKSTFNIVIPQRVALELNAPQKTDVAILIGGEIYRVAVKLNGQWFPTFLVRTDPALLEAR